MNKRLLLANIYMHLGGRFISRFANRELLFVLTYHRIKKDDGSPSSKFDDEVFGPSVTEFRRQLEFLSKYTTVLSESDLIAAMSGEPPGDGPFGMVTFDDAYVDNYELALPVLRQMGLPSILFVPYTLLEERKVGWWDQIAFIVKNSSKPTIELRGEKIRFGNDTGSAIRYLQSIMKHNPTDSTKTLIDEIAERADSPPPTVNEMSSELMTWDQVRTAAGAGVTIGSHTCSHRVLATLGEREQSDEIFGSKSCLENKLGVPIRSLAFPVGGIRHYNSTTTRLARDAGYDLAFSFCTGVEKLQKCNRFEIPRFSAPHDLETFKAHYHCPRLMDYGFR
ncbi:polysaccharide deacetylase family protein [Lacipirellula limnantheis]|uniref:Polysaccharide deacetylase n=1 Tax=Lacipirellula limnantheis TaxID=2528024 RepID=A0A517TY89_9BACT|nr:polysaccharide deacetylase family protein [Lacipirellula limnantheis]QDT73339.1 Polysaccharide deacetylase [Lacipirellula limnantheis]